MTKPPTTKPNAHNGTNICWHSILYSPHASANRPHNVHVINEKTLKKRQESLRNAKEKKQNSDTWLSKISSSWRVTHDYARNFISVSQITDLSALAGFQMQLLRAIDNTAHYKLNIVEYIKWNSHLWMTTTTQKTPSEPSQNILASKLQHVYHPRSSLQTYMCGGHNRTTMTEANH